MSMLHYPGTYLFTSVFAAIFGFGSWGGWIAELAEFVFFVCLALFFLACVFNGPEPLHPAPIKSGRGNK